LRFGSGESLETAETLGQDFCRPLADVRNTESEEQTVKRPIAGLLEFTQEIGS